MIDYRKICQKFNSLTMCKYYWIEDLPITFLNLQLSTHIIATQPKSYQSIRPRDESFVGDR